MSKRDKLWYLLICVFLATVVAGVYWPVRNYELVRFDDDLYVTLNNHVTSGLNWENIRWAFTGGYASNWHPLTWISHMVDCEIYGMRAGGHHFTNLIFHAANAVLLFAVFEYMTGAMWASAFVAAMFALHPLHVESAAWVAERKDLLSTFFMILAIWAYAKYVRNPSVRRYVITLVLFAAGLMAKPMLVTLPFIFLLLDYWPLERMTFGGDDSEGGGVTAGVERRSVGYLVKEKIPFFVMSAVSSVVTFVVQHSGGATKLMEYYNFKIRLANAIVSYAVYIEKMLWPSRLGVLYMYHGDILPMRTILGSVAVLAALSFVFIYLGRRRKYLATGWLWYVGMLVPVIGLVQVGSQAMADRYTYMPLTGLFIIIAWGAWELAARFAGRKVVLSVLAAGVLCASALTTARQVRYWKTSLTLFEHTLEVSPDAWTVANNYGNTLREAGRVAEAITCYKRAIEMKPDFAEAYHNLGNSFRAIDRFDDAVASYKKAIEFKPDFFLAHAGLASTLAQQGKNDEAFAAFHKALEIKPDDAETVANLGLLYMNNKQVDEAIKRYRRAIELKPDYVIAHGRLGMALAEQGKYEEAIKEFEVVLKASPKDVEMHCNIGILLEKLGRDDEAELHYRLALKIKSGDEKSHDLLAALLKKKKEGR